MVVVVVNRPSPALTTVELRRPYGGGPAISQRTTAVHHRLTVVHGGAPALTGQTPTLTTTLNKIILNNILIIYLINNF